MNRLSAAGFCLLSFVLCALLAPVDANAGRWEVRKEIREGARSVERERREARRELQRCKTRECARREMREGYREVAREKREARREIRGEIGDLDTAVRAVDAGAFDYLVKPFDLEQVSRTVARALADRAADGPGTAGAPAA